MSQEKQALPFFVRYLESQAEDMTAEELNEVYGGSAAGVTKAYPSDSDTLDGGRIEESPHKDPYDIDFNFPAFPSNFPFLNNSSPINPGPL
jgi:Serine endopeptidase inhibitors